MAFTKGLPTWNALGTEPPQSLKDDGWQATQKPPAEYFNWLQYTAFQAMKELQEKAGEVKTINGTGPDANGNVAVDTATTWSEVTEKPTAFTPEAHSHEISEVTNLQTTLNGKASTQRVDDLEDFATTHPADDEIHHTHNNKTTLDSLSDDGSGGLRYKGTSVGEVSQTEFDNHTNNSDIHKTSSEIRGEASTKIVLETRTTDPSTPELGRIWVRSDL